MLEVLGEAALRTLLLAACVGCGLRLLRIRQPQVLLAAWTVVLATSISMPMIARLAPLRIPVTPAFPTMLIDDASTALASTAAQGRPTEVSFETRPEPSLRGWLEAGYVAVAAAIAVRVLLGVALSLRLLARSVPIHADWVGRTRVRISREVATPVTVAHCILLPPDAESWSAETRRAVLAHERAHVARWDFALLVLAQLNRALFWFSPLSWWLHRRLIILSELASDDQALAVTQDPLGYAEILLEMGRRSGPVLRGPAMARLSTLASRIDRILDEPAYQGGDPLLRVVTTAAVAGLSVAAASCVLDPVRVSAIAPPPQLITAGVAAADSQSPSEAGTNPDGLWDTTERAPVLKERSPPTVSLHRAQVGLRPSLPSSSKAVPHLSPRPSTQDSGRQSISRLQPVEVKTFPPLRAPDRNARTWGGQADIEPRLPLPPDVTPAASPPQRSLGFEDVMRSTCTGTIVVGLRARQSTQPNVVAGQTVEAEAQFFRRESGASWVRFFAFGRPPLDLPVSFTQGRLTWTGEYGIAYAVQPSGGDHLVGLAAQVAADSAQLEFTCRKAIVRTL